MTTPIFHYTEATFGPLEALQSEVLAAVQAGSPQVAVDIDGLGTLDIEAIRGLITLLRRVREAGAELALRVTRDDLKRTLSVTALDRIIPNILEREPAFA
ncbi:MAG: STAS domain-containing protein [Candidatus Eremiobacteraeota bacterium]|nr:STAS domain-containing protein [Candidatus Eremiobacteraeota bacterium]